MRWWVRTAIALVALAGCSGNDGVALPPAGAPVDYQLGGAYPPAKDVGIVVRDREAEPDPDRWSVCYVNAFQTQPGTDEVPAHLLLRDDGGERVEDPDWPGEYLLDVSTERARTAVVDTVGAWIDGCADDGFDAVELDNLDSWTRSGGLLDRSDAEATARALTTRAHAAGLAAAQKNAVDLVGTDLGFDFAVTEECAAFDECDRYRAAFDVVLEIEYSDVAFRSACAADLTGVSVVRRDLELLPAGDPGHVLRWCD